MKRDVDFETYIKEVKKPFSGWDFSYITESGRMATGMLSWSYGSMVTPLIGKVSSMLDMGTGGGELLSKLQPFPAVVCATEGYPPNVSIAKENLEPLGVQVFQIGDDDLLPFEDHTFDLIINKHESFSPLEVKRTLTDGGIFLTQQVGGSDCAEINTLLGYPINEEFSHWNLRCAENELRENRFEILEAKEEFPVQRFYDIGALLYYLDAIPWQVPEFKIESSVEKLRHIHKLIQMNGYLEVKQHRFLIKARKK